MSRLASCCWPAVVAGATLLVTSSVQAKEWYLIHGHGKRPDRHLFYAQETLAQAPVSEVMAAIENQVENKTPGSVAALEANYRGAEITEVMEGKDGPDLIVHEVEFRCDTSLARIKSTFTTYRDTDRHEQGGDQGWNLLSEGPKWLAQAKRFACEPQSRTAANKMMPVGDYVFGTQLADLTWANYWPDGERPPYTTTKSREQLNAEREAAIAQLQATRATVQAMAADFKEKHDEDTARNAAFQEKIMTDTKRRGSLHAMPVLETWVGAKETELVNAFGTPPGFSQSDRSRFLTYSVGTVTELVHVSGAVHGTEDRTCKVRFEVRDGVVYTYSLDGYTLSCKSYNFPPGPFPEKGAAR